MTRCLGILLGLLLFAAPAWAQFGGAGGFPPGHGSGGGGGGGGAVNAVTGSGNISSSGGSTPNITFSGVLPASNGGNADALGRIGKGNANYLNSVGTFGSNTATATAANELVEFFYSDTAHPARVDGFNGTLSGHTTPIGICTGAGCGGANGSAVTIIHHGPATCDFDGAATANDIFTYSTSSSAHTCHDCGAAQPGACSTTPEGVITATIGSAGTTTVVADFPLPTAIHQYGKCIVGSNTTVTAQTGTPPAQNLWTTICSVTFPPLPVNPGWGNAEVLVTPGNFGIQTLDAVPTDLVCEASVTSACASPQTQLDPHGYGTAFLATYAPNTAYQHIPVPAPYGALWEQSVGSDNPISCGCTASIKCFTVTNNLTILAAATGPGGLADDGTQVAFTENVLMAGIGN